MNENFEFAVGMTGKTREGADYEILATFPNKMDYPQETMVVRVADAVTLYFADGGYFGLGDRSEQSLRAPERSLYILDGHQQGYPRQYLTFETLEEGRAALECAEREAHAIVDAGGPQVRFTLHTVALPR